MQFQPTNESFENEYPKLVRDNIPQIIKDRNGEEVATRILADDTEFLKYLLKKVVEESRELEFSLENGNMEEELADVYELLEKILQHKNINKKIIDKIRSEKIAKNGGFEKRILMLAKPKK